VNKHPAHEQAEQAKALILEIFSESISSPHFIGCLLPLSGPYKTYGYKALQGIELALNAYHRANKEKPIHLIVKDTASNPFQAVQAVRELDEANVSAIIGPIISAEPAAMEAQSRGIPIILFTQKGNIAQIGEFVFRNFITPRMQIEPLAEHAVRKMGLKRFAILYPDENYGNTYMNLFWDEVLSLGGAVVGAESYDPMDTDFAKPIKKLVGLYYQVPKELQIDFVFTPEEDVNRDPMAKTTTDMFAFLPDETKYIPELFFWGFPQPLGPLAGDDDRGRKRDDELEPIVDFDALFIPDAAKKAGLITPQLAYFDIEDVVLIGTNLWHSPQLINMSQDYIQGAVLTDGFFAESKETKVRVFLEDFLNTFDEKPGFIEAVAYDSTKILLQTLVNPRIRFKSHLKDELLNLVDFPGVTGSTSFDYKGDAIRAPYILQVKGRSFATLQSP
jgi:ABC-type branched-subunit amino acid transport system substrate-binding protein